MKIKFASQDRVNKYQEEIDTLLELIDHQEALVTDASTFSDFFSVLDYSTELASQVALEQKLGGAIPFYVNVRNLLCEVAEQMARLR